MLVKYSININKTSNHLWPQNHWPQYEDQGM